MYKDSNWTPTCFLSSNTVTIADIPYSSSTPWTIVADMNTVFTNSDPENCVPSLCSYSDCIGNTFSELTIDFTSPYSLEAKADIVNGYTYEICY